MGNSLKILEYQDNQLEKESSFVLFLSNFPNLYDCCQKEQKRRIIISSIILKESEALLKIINFEKDKKIQFYKEILLNGVDHYPNNFFPNLLNEDNILEVYFLNLKSFLVNQINEEKKGFIF